MAETEKSKTDLKRTRASATAKNTRKCLSKLTKIDSSAYETNFLENDSIEMRGDDSMEIDSEGSMPTEEMVICNQNVVPAIDEVQSDMSENGEFLGFSPGDIQPATNTNGKFSSLVNICILIFVSIRQYLSLRLVCKRLFIFFFS